MHKSPYIFAPDAHIIILFLVKMNNERRVLRIQTVYNLLWPDESYSEEITKYREVNAFSHFPKIFG